MSQLGVRKIGSRGGADRPGGAGRPARVVAILSRAPQHISGIDREHLAVALLYSRAIADVDRDLRARGVGADLRRLTLIALVALELCPELKSERGATVFGRIGLARAARTLGRLSAGTRSTWERANALRALVQRFTDGIRYGANQDAGLREGARFKPGRGEGAAAFRAPV